MGSERHGEGAARAFGAAGFTLLLAVSMSSVAACSSDESTEPAGKDAAAIDDAGDPPDSGTDAGAAPSGPIHLTTLAQIGAVVEDAAAASEAFTQVLGIGPWTIVDQTGENPEGMPFAARLAYAYVGDIELELVEVTSGETAQTEFLRDHGEGLYDLGFFVDDVDDHVARLQSRGATVLLQEPGEWAYVDSPDADGVIFKLTEMRDKLEIDATGFEPPEGSLQPTQVDHVGAWSADVNATAAKWESAFGVGSWNIFPYSITSVTGDSLSAILGFTAALGATEIELVQIISGPVPEELRRGGMGLWEVAIEVADPVAEATKLVDRGARIIVQAEVGTTIVDVGAGGVAFELVPPAM